MLTTEQLSRFRARLEQQREALRVEIADVKDLLAAPEAIVDAVSDQGDDGNMLFAHEQAIGELARLQLYMTFGFKVQKIATICRLFCYDKLGLIWLVVAAKDAVPLPARDLGAWMGSKREADRAATMRRIANLRSGCVTWGFTQCFQLIWSIASTIVRCRPMRNAPISRPLRP